MSNRDDLENILGETNVVKSIKENMELLLDIIPELKPMIGFEHKHPHHHLDVWNHTLLAVSLSDDLEIRLILLLHDIGKPHSFTEENGVRHFHGHPKVSSDISKVILDRLGYEKTFIDKVCYLIEMHDTPITVTDIINDYDLSYERYLVQKCDALAHNPEKLKKRKEYLNERENILKKLYNYNEGGRR